MFRKSSLLLFAVLVGTVLAYQAINSTHPSEPQIAVNGSAPAAPAASTPAPPVVLPPVRKPRLARVLPPGEMTPPLLAQRNDVSDPLPLRFGKEPQAREREREAGKHYDKPDEAAAYYQLKRAPKNLSGIPTERYAVARQQMAQMRTYSSRQGNFIASSPGKAAPELLFGGAWTPLGPGNIGGRTRALLINPANPNIVYAAGASGGIWRSTDGGLNWLALGDIMANLAVCTMVLDPTNPNVIYAGTGEGFGNGDAVRGAGIFKTTNGGITWDQLPATSTPDFYYVNKLVISAKDSNRLYAATRTGIWRSLNGGVSWTKTYATTVELGVLDLAVRTDKTADVVFATTGYAFGGGDFGTILRNSDAANTNSWDQVYAEDGIGRIALALAPTDQNVVYASAATPRGDLFAVLRSTSSGDTGSWVKRVRGDDSNTALLNRLLFSSVYDAFAVHCGISLNASTYSQGWYDNAIAVDPADSNRVWVGGIDLLRSDDGGANWGLASYYYLSETAPQSVHVDQHAIVFHPHYNGTTNQTMFVGNDGGLYRTDNARAKVAVGNAAACNVKNSDVAWARVNNSYGVTQFYHGAVYPDGKSYFGGTQDNGTVRGTDSGGLNNWQEINGGDGGYVAVNPFNTNTLFAEFTGISLRKSTNGGVSFHTATAGLFTNGLFITPYAMDPSDPNRLWIGGDSLYRTTNAATFWAEASDYLHSGYYVSAIAIAPTDANWVLAGDEAGFIYGTDSALSTTYRNEWDYVRPRNGFVSGITIDPKDKNIAYATYSTFGDPHVWRTINGGQTWQSLDGTGANALPDIPVHCLVIDPSNTQRLYVGTDLGVFASLDGGAAWSVENTGFPNVVVEALTLNIQNGVTTLYAFTHGRGAWKVDINNTGCNYALSNTGQSVAQAGGTSSVGLTASSGACGWIAKSNEPWITVNSFTGTTVGTVNFTVAANNTFWPRIGTIEIAGRSYTLTQAGKNDAVVPTIQVTSPTTQSTFATTTNPLVISATIKDNDAVDFVQWRNSRGNSGIFFPTGAGDNWKSNNINLRTGLNFITITATDRTGNTATATLAVSLNAQADDTTVPTVKINFPTTNPTFITSGGLLTLEGTAADNRQLTHLLWSNDRGGSGRALGTTAWEIEDIPLQVGVNKLTVTAYDINANTSQAVLTVLSNPAQTTRRIAGTDPRSFGFNGDNRQATTAQLWAPNGLAFDATGNLFIADTLNHRIRKVTPAGVITTVAGNGSSGLNGDGGPATQASLHSPYAIVFDGAGNLYIADASNHKIRKVAPDNTITTFAGTGQGGFSGDNGKAINATLNFPLGLAVDASGNLLIGDTLNHRVRKVNASDGTIVTVAGNGSPGAGGDGGDATLAQLFQPIGVALDRKGNLFIADASNFRLCKVGTDGKISRFAGTGNPGYSGDGGLATAADIGVPFHLAVDKDGNVVFVDNAYTVVRRITTDGKIVTVFGSEFGAALEGIAPTGYGFFDPRGLALDAVGNLYVSDSANQRVVAATSLNAVATVESAGYTGPMIARDALVASFGVKLATAEAFAPSNPAQLPTMLVGTTVTLRDSKGVDRAALLLYVSPSQVNYITPDSIAEGFAMVTVRNSLGETATGFIEIVGVMPGLFSANADGAGAAIGWAIRVRNGAQLPRESLITLNPATNKFVPKAIDFDPATEALYLEIYGTGIRYRSSLANVVCEIGGVKVPVEYAFVAPGFYGLDQVNVKLPASLDNRGEVDLVLTVDGRKAKTLRVNIK